METALRCIGLRPGEGARRRRSRGGRDDVAGGRRRGRRLPTPGLRETARLQPTARPGPTVEFEMADALALGVPGRGAAEAAPQGLGQAALRPPAAARKG